MNTIDNRPENRYLESPYSIRETGLDTQMPFSEKNSLEGGHHFSQKNSFPESPVPDNEG
ncbi:MAG: hypothetical protein WC582_00875 [Patescibacteria group bacterium]